jgi:hypothetical protein
MDNNAENADINGNEEIAHEDLVLGYRLPRWRTNWRVRHDGLSQRQAATLRQLEASRSEKKTEYEYVLLLITILSAALAKPQLRFFFQHSRPSAVCYLFPPRIQYS